MSRLVRRSTCGACFGGGPVAVVALTPGVAAASTVNALWHMDEAAGATLMVDFSGHDNTGTLHNVTAGVLARSYRLQFRRLEGTVLRGGAGLTNAEPGHRQDQHLGLVQHYVLPTSGDLRPGAQGGLPRAGVQGRVCCRAGSINCEFLGASAHVVAPPVARASPNGAWHPHQLHSQTPPGKKTESSAARWWPAPPKPWSALSRIPLRGGNRGPPGQRLVQGQARRGVDHRWLTTPDRV